MSACPNDVDPSLSRAVPTNLSLRKAYRDHPSAEERSWAAAIIARGRSLHRRNLLAACDGNISVRLSDDRILLTPSGRNKAFLTSADLAVIGLDGRALRGSPSSEWRMHVAVYQVCPEARAVVHAHPPTAIAWTLAHPDLTELPADALPEAIVAAGRIPVVPYARPGTAEMGAFLLPYLPAHRLFVLAKHGGLCWGESLDEAYNGIERLEHVATILKIARELGGIAPLPADERSALYALRKRIAPRIF